MGVLWHTSKADANLDSGRTEESETTRGDVISVFLHKEKSNCKRWESVFTSLSI